MQGCMLHSKNVKDNEYITPLINKLFWFADKIKGAIMVREITEKDYNGLMTLYMQLHDHPMPEETADLIALWER